MRENATDLLGEVSNARLEPHDEVYDRIADRAAKAEGDPNGLRYEVDLLAKSALLIHCFKQKDFGDDTPSSLTSTTQIFDIFRSLGRSNLSVGRLFEGHFNAVKLVELYGSPYLIAQAREVVEAGGLLGVWGADSRHAVTFEKTSSNARKLDGKKVFASGLGLVRLAVITMRAQHENNGPTQLALVDVSDPRRQDAAAWTATGMRATHSGIFDFSGVVIDEKQCLGSPGDYNREPHFDGGIWRYCAVHLGGAEAILREWRASLRARGRLNDPFQLARFARGVGLYRAAISLLRETAQCVESAAKHHGVNVSNAVGSALLARQVTEEACVEILALAEKSLGTFAHMSNDIERVRRDLSMFLRQAAIDDKLLKAANFLLKEDEIIQW